MVLTAMTVIVYFTEHTYALPQNEDSGNLEEPIVTPVPETSLPPENNEDAMESEIDEDTSEPSRPDAQTYDTDEDRLSEQTEQDNLPEEPECEEVPEDLPGWIIHGQQHFRGNLALAEQIKLLEAALQAELDRIREVFDMPFDIDVGYDEDNLVDILAIYAVKRGMTENFPYSIRIDDEFARQELLSIFWSMTRVSGTTQVIDGGNVYRLHVYRESHTDYPLSPEEKQEVEELAAIGSDVLRTVYDNSILSMLTDQEFHDIQLQLEGMIGNRRSVLLAALSLEDKVPYFWGGKSHFIGWDLNWGEERMVTAAGNRSSGTVRPFGLDCTGFISWVFINAGGTANQWRSNIAIEWNALQPGDLLYYYEPASPGTNHVGIVIGQDDNGQVRVIHCSSGRNGVVVTGPTGFNYAHRPYVFRADD